MIVSKYFSQVAIRDERILIYKIDIGKINKVIKLALTFEMPIRYSSIREAHFYTADSARSLN